MRCFRKTAKNEHFCSKRLKNTKVHNLFDDGIEKHYASKMVNSISDVGNEDIEFEEKCNEGDDINVQLYKEPKEDIYLSNAF